jgi:hypothetical protein
MANRYHRITGSKKISQDYGNINEMIGAVEQDVVALETRATTTENELIGHVNDDNRHWTADDRNKMSGVSDGAEPNQNAFTQVNGIDADNPLDSFTIAAGPGIAVTVNHLTKTINITATGEAIPGDHAASHLPDGADPIPLATTSNGGLMSAADKDKLNKLTAPPWTWADLEGGL